MKYQINIFSIIGIFIIGITTGYFIQKNFNNKEKMVNSLLIANSNTISYLQLENSKTEDASNFLLMGIASQISIIRDLDYEIADLNDIKLFTQILSNYKKARFCKPKMKLPEAVALPFDELDKYVDLQIEKLSGSKMIINCPN